MTNRKTSCVAPLAVVPTFTYLDERFDADFTINALSAGNIQTQNYQGAFAKLTTFPQVALKAVSIAPTRTAFDTQAASPRLAPINPVTVNWTKGVSGFSIPLKISRDAIPDGPYLGTALGVAPVDTDGVAATGLNLDTDVPLLTPAVSDHVQIGTATEFRYGRLRLGSVTGTVEYPLSMPLTAEYWSGSAFVTNTDDTGCSTISSAAAVLGNYQGPLVNGLVHGDTTLSGSGKLVAGKASFLQLSPPLNGHTGSVDVTLDLTGLPWLQFDWNGDGAFDTGVNGTASFGLYRGSDRVIFWQETAH